MRKQRNKYVKALVATALLSMSLSGVAGAEGVPTPEVTDYWEYELDMELPKGGYSDTDGSGTSGNDTDGSGMGDSTIGNLGGDYFGKLPDNSSSESNKMSSTPDLYMDVVFSGGVNYFPYMTFTVKNTRTGVEKTVITANGMDEYNRDKRAVEVVLKGMETRTGDKLEITLKDRDTLLTHVFTQDRRETVQFEKDKKATISIENINEGGEYFLEGSKKNPITVFTSHKKNQLYYKVTDEEGNILPDTEVEIIVGNSKKPEKVVTDEDGYLKLDRDKIQPYFLVRVPGLGEKYTDLPTNAFSDEDMNYLHEETIRVPITDDQYVAKIQEEEESKAQAQKGNIVSYNVTFKTNVDTRLSTKWMQATVETKDGSNYTVKGDKATIDVEGKIDIAKITSKTAKVTGHKVSGKSLTITLEPLHTFVLHDEGKHYDITVINKQNQNFKGTEKIVFGLAPKEVLQIKNNLTGSTYSYATTGDKEGSSQSLIASKGKGKGNNNGDGMTNPHTNDIITALSIATILGVLLIISLFIIRRKIRGVSTMLVLILIGGQFAPYGEIPKAEASNVGGGDSNTDGSQGLSGTMLQMVEYIAAYEVYFVDFPIDGSVQQKENYYIDQSGDKRFDRSARKNAFYFTPDTLTYNSLRYNGSGVVEYNDNVGSHQSESSVSNLQVINGTNAIKTYLGSNLVKDSQSSTNADMAKRVINPMWGVEGNTHKGKGDYFINTMGGIMKKAYTRSSPNTTAPISGSYNNQNPAGYKDPFGEAAAKLFNETISNDSDPSAKANREKLVKSYLELVKEKGLVKNYASFEASMMKALDAGSLTLQINTIIGVTQYKSTGNKPHGAKPYAFMSVHDAATWYYYQMRMLRGEGRVGTIDPLYEKKTARVGLPADSKLYWKWGRIGFTFRQYLTNAYTITVQPKGEDGVYPTLTLAQANTDKINSNPYGGWFFQRVGEVESSKPIMFVTAELNVLDEEGQETGRKVNIKVPEWTRSARKTLDSMSTAVVRFQETYTVAGKVYNVEPEATVKIKSEDNVFVNNTNTDLGSLTPPKRMDTYNRRMDLSDVSGPTDVINTTLGTHKIVLDPFFADYKALSIHLGGSKQEKDTSTGATVTNKYYNTKSGQTPVNGDFHVHLILDAKIEEDTTEDGVYTVPQWSLAEIEVDDFEGDKVKTVFDIGDIDEIHADAEHIAGYSFYKHLYPQYFTTAILGRVSGDEDWSTIKATKGIPLYLDVTEPLVDRGQSWYQPVVEYNKDEIKKDSKNYRYVSEQEVGGKFKQPSSTRNESSSIKGYLEEYKALNNMVYDTPINTYVRLIRSYLDLDIKDYIRLNEPLGKVTKGPVKGADSRYKAAFVESDYEYFYNPSTYLPSDKIVKEDTIVKADTMERMHSVGVTKWEKRDKKSYRMRVQQKLHYRNKYKYTLRSPKIGIDKDGNEYTYYVYITFYTERDRQMPKEGIQEDSLTYESLKLQTEINVTYDKYVAQEQEGDTPPPTKLKDTGKFSTWSVENDDRKFKFYPEVVMYNEQDYDFDENKYEYSVDVVLGEAERKLNTHFYVKADLVPKDDSGEVGVKASVNGGAAVDAQAQILAQGLNSVQQTPVLPKGSSTVNSLGFENAEIDMRLYYLDIKDNIVKSQFNPDASGWDTTAEKAQEYVNSLKNDKGEIKGTARGYYYIGENEYEPTLKDIGYRQVSEPTVNEYEIEVRGGEVTRIARKDADVLRKNVRSIYGPSDADACRNDKVYQRDAEVSAVCAMTHLTMFDDAQGVFSVLEKQVGHDITADWDDFVTTGNELRNLKKEHDKAIKVGKEWYYEDTTIYVVREYHYKYSIPTYMWTAKLPMSFDGLGLETPVDKSQFYSQGVPSYVGTEFTFGDADKFQLKMNINPKEIEDNDYNLLQHDKGHQYIVPNVSVLDGLR